MGICESVPKSNSNHQKYESLKNIKNEENSKIETNNFYNFTEYLLQFQFYIKLFNDDQKSTKLITKKNGPNDKNIHYLIKSIDQINNNNVNKFPFPIIKSKSAKNKLYKMNINHKFSDNNNNDKFDLKIFSTTNLPFTDLRSNIQTLIEKLCKHNIKKLQKILIFGPPNNLRWLIYHSIAKINYEIIEKHVNVSSEQIYLFLIGSSFSNPNSEDLINSNLNQTMNEVKYFKSPNWLQSLKNVLKSLLIYNKNIEYNKEMNEIAANALIISDCNEPEVFNLLRFFYSNYYGLGLSNFYINNSSKLKYYIFFISELINERMPVISNIIKTYKIEPDFWLKDWLVYLFSKQLSFNVRIRLWDCLFAQGSDFLIKYSFGYLKYLENTLNNCNSSKSFFDILNNDKNKIRSEKETCIFREQLIQNAINCVINKNTIKRIEEKYVLYLKNNLSIDEKDIKENYLYSNIKYNKNDNEEIDNILLIKGCVYRKKTAATINQEDIKQEILDKKKILNALNFLQYNISNHDNMESDTNEEDEEIIYLDDYNDNNNKY